MATAYLIAMCVMLPTTGWLAPKRYFHPQYEALFPMGCYHSQELALYGPSVQRNIKKRIAAFR